LDFPIDISFVFCNVIINSHRIKQLNEAWCLIHSHHPGFSKSKKYHHYLIDSTGIVHFLGTANFCQTTIVSIRSGTPKTGTGRLPHYTKKFSCCWQP